ALACISIQSNQNDQHGGQSVPKFDFDMAAGVKKTYVRHFRNNLDKSFELNGIHLNAGSLLDKIKETYQMTPTLNNREIDTYIKEFVDGDVKVNKLLDFVTKEATKETVRDTYQAMESLIHNLN